MATIKAYTSYDERNKRRFYRTFDIVEPDDLKDAKSISEIYLDVEQGRDDIHDYEFYKVTRESDFEDEEDDVTYVAVKKSSLYSWNIEFYPSNFQIFISRFDLIKEGYDSEVIDKSVDGMSFEDYSDMDDWISGIMEEVSEHGYFDEDDIIDMERMLRNQYDELIGADEDDE